MKKISLISYCIIVFISISFITIRAIDLDVDFITKIQQFENNIIDYANGNNWLYDGNLETGDTSDEDALNIDSTSDSVITENVLDIEPEGYSGLDSFSYYIDLESNAYFQVYETDTDIYFVSWAYDSTVNRPNVIENFKK